ncbi:MAG: type II toxin-antitoxin system RatA family toxin [Betaproteobacteria bacterium]|jgi:ribosome-associated toxin RatA of RatAB toxin-antitoxin module|nr:type II toxin-antitoxin system RatA family toxin [Betaproteobacteria bacterium]NCW63524.1 type II toxin-antitoxin system RatA family toxin [Betaproteobacteria bacterium]NCX68645.1 type II toxin-antitoxin system RatA family toxin [Betaproteobacteria bacterium]
MHNIHKSAIVLHSSKKMFQLVDSVENYPRFLPWCGSTQILERDNSKTIASIEINYKGIRQTFTTENTKKQNKEMMIKLIDGPFQSLSGQWIFKNLDNDSCQIELKLEYQFSNIILEKLISPVFNMIANTFIDEFIKEANKSNNDQ